MGIFDDTAIFTAIIQYGGFSHAARHLGLSNGMISRRLAQLEADLGVTLLKRTTRQIHLTPEGEIYWQHAQRIQQEMDAAVSMIQSSAKKPKGAIRVSAPLYFGRHYLTPVILKFLVNFPDISVSLVLGNQRIDPVKEQFDLVIRGAGYLEDTKLQNSNLQMKMLVQEKIGIYASPEYLVKCGQPETVAELSKHIVISYTDGRQPTDVEKWKYSYDSENAIIHLTSKFTCNDIESGLIACSAGYGIGRFTYLNAKSLVQSRRLRPVLMTYD